MKSRVTDEFIALFRTLPREVQALARKNYRLWRDDANHPGLQFKRVRAKEPIYCVRVGLRWRAVGLLEGDTITWYWIGSHADYDRIPG